MVRFAHKGGNWKPSTVKRFKVLNFGPISDVDIEFEGITAIIGPNNSGKTFLSLLLYVLLTSFEESASEFDLDLYSEYTKRNRQEEGSFSNTNVYKTILSKIKPLTETNPTGKEVELEETLVKDLLTEIAKRNSKYLADRIALGLKGNFGVSIEKLVKFGEQNSEVSLEVDDIKMHFVLGNDGKVAAELEVSNIVPSSVFVKYDSGKLSFVLKKVGSRSEYIVHLGSSKAIKTQSRILEIINIAITDMFYEPRSSIELNPAIVPVERIAVITVFYDLLDLYMKSLGARRVLASKVAEIWRDKPIVMKFMEEMLGSIRRNENKKRGLDIISGAYTVSQKDYLEINYKDSAGSLIPTPLLSSSLAQIIPMDMVSSDPHFDFIITEEPEINLHANKQVEMANYLLELNKALFITTHSDIFLMELALQTKSKTKDRKRKNVKIYLLNDGKTSEVTIFENGALSRIQTIADVINNQLDRIVKDE
jgi:AAA15 family ATPase/GTPase